MTKKELLEPSSGIKNRLLALPIGANATFEGLIVERGAVDRWVVNRGMHAHWTDLDGAVADLARDPS